MGGGWPRSRGPRGWSFSVFQPRRDGMSKRLGRPKPPPDSSEAPTSTHRWSRCGASKRSWPDWRGPHPVTCRTETGANRLVLRRATGDAARRACARSRSRAHLPGPGFCDAGGRGVGVVAPTVRVIFSAKRTWSRKSDDIRVRQAAGDVPRDDDARHGSRSAARPHHSAACPDRRRPKRSRSASLNRRPPPRSGARAHSDCRGESIVAVRHAASLASAGPGRRGRAQPSSRA
jgi:hypothetical protein